MKIAIIGAGLTGLSTAYHFEKNGFDNFEIFEQESTPGGLCRSTKQDGFTFDFTGHFLHVNNQYFKSFINETISLKSLNLVKRNSKIFSHNTYIRYPFQANLFGLPPEIIADCIEGFVKRKSSIEKPQNFYQWVLKYFGIGLAKHFFGPYQKKIFCCDLQKLSTSWMGRFVPKTTLRDLIIGATKDLSEKAFGYNKSLYYPKSGGIYSFTSSVAKSVRKKISLNHKVKSVNIKTKEVIFENGESKKFDVIISTIPLNNLLKNMLEPTNINLKTKAKNLKSNKVININLGISKPKLSDMHWVYFPEKQYPFYRAGFYSNVSSKMAPQGCSSLYAEIATLNASKKLVEEKIKESKKQLKKIFNFNESEISAEKNIVISPCYVIYDHWRDKNLNKILKTLESFSIYSVGRYGQWKYSSMQEAILDGKEVVERILNGRI